MGPREGRLGRTQGKGRGLQRRRSCRRVARTRDNKAKARKDFQSGRHPSFLILPDSLRSFPSPWSTLLPPPPSLSLSEWTKGMRPLEEAPIASGDGGDKTCSASHGAVLSEFHITQQKHERALGFAGEDGWAPALAAAASCLSPLPSLPRRRVEQTEGLGAEVPNPSRHQEPVLL